VSHLAEHGFINIIIKVVVTAGGENDLHGRAQQLGNLVQTNCMAASVTEASIAASK
jgi:hypothetical protein